MSLADSQSVSPNEPIHDTPILGMTTRPRVQNATEFGNPLSFWVVPRRSRRPLALCALGGRREREAAATCQGRAD